MSWHVDAGAARAYADGRLDDPSSWSLEAHVQQCSACARVVSAAADPLALERVREQLAVRRHAPARGFVRLTVTPMLSVGWLASVAGVVVGVLALDLVDATRVPMLLLLAPLVPLLGLAVGCAPSFDRTAELTASTPMSALYVLLLRAGAVLAVSVPPLLLVSLLTDAGPLRWLAPSAGLVGLALALTTRLRVEAATAIAAAVWAVLTLGPATVATPVPPGLASGSTAGWLTLTAVSAVLLAVRQDRLEHWNGTGAGR